MFDILKKFKNLIIAVVLAVCIVVTAGSALIGYSYKKQNDNLRLQVNALTIANNAMKEQIEKGGKSNSVTDKTNQAISDAKDANVKNESDIRKKLDKELADLERKYPEATITEVQRAQKRIEERAIRVNALWLSYCVKNKQDEQCKKN